MHISTRRHRCVAGLAALLVAGVISGTGYAAADPGDGTDAGDGFGTSQTQDDQPTAPDPAPADQQSDQNIPAPPSPDPDQSDTDLQPAPDPSVGDTPPPDPDPSSTQPADGTPGPQDGLSTPAATSTPSGPEMTAVTGAITGEPIADGSTPTTNGIEPLPGPADQPPTLPAVPPTSADGILDPSLNPLAQYDDPPMQAVGTGVAADMLENGLKTLWLGPEAALLAAVEAPVWTAAVGDHMDLSTPENRIADAFNSGVVFGLPTGPGALVAGAVSAGTQAVWEYTGAKEGYDCVVRNQCDTQPSQPAAATVTAPQNPADVARLIQAPASGVLPDAAPAIGSLGSIVPIVNGK